VAELLVLRPRERDVEHAQADQRGLVGEDLEIDAEERRVELEPVPQPRDGSMALARIRRIRVGQGSFADGAAADRFIDDLEALHADPTRVDLRDALGVGDALLDEDVRTCEVRNWLASLVD
jgi:hypothetical protein